MSEIMPSTPMLSLTERDVDRLLQEQSADSRVDVVQKIASNYNTGSFSERELQIAEQIFRHVAKDTESKVRGTLSTMLKDNQGIPRDIALKFAHDPDISVALPMLESSLVLSEYDLISIIETANESQRLTAIAKRNSVTERISDALIESRQQDAVNALVQNETARISEQSYRAIIQTFHAQSEVMNSLAKREELPVTVAEKLISYVSDQLANQLRDQYRLEEQDISRQTQSVRETATLHLLDHDQSDEAHAALVSQMAEEERLSPSLILSSLCRGNVLFFEMALARLANIPLSNAQLLIYDKGGLGFKRLYEKTGLPESLFEATRVTMQVIKHMQEDGEQPGTIHFSNRAVAQILSEADGKEVENLSYIIALIRQHGKAA
jgi:uncharacterized protein (DUF2336 family)